MRYCDLFIESELPEQLSKKELDNYFKKMQCGDIEAREEIITHNIRLVISFVLSKFINTNYELSELVAVGLIGLIKGVDTFDVNKNFQFSTYAIKCIKNEILMFMRKEKQHNNDKSLNEIIVTDNGGKELKLEDRLIDINCDIVSDYEEKELYNIIRNIIDELPEKGKNIIIKRFGFIGNCILKQKDIAVELEMSESYISKKVYKILNDIENKLKETEIIEVSSQHKYVKKR